MALGPLKYLVDLATVPVRVGLELIGGLLGGRGGDGSVAPSPEPAATARDTKPKPWLDDVALARKVETTIFRDRKVPKGKIDVNVADGVVWLRGEAKTPAMINELERKAQQIPEVDQVENLLHLPKTPAPSRTDTPPSQRKTRRSPRAQTKRRVTSKKVTAEKRSASKQASSPSELARKRRGRQSAPMGGKGGGRKKSS